MLLGFDLDNGSTNSDNTTCLRAMQSHFHPSYTLGNWDLFHMIQHSITVKPPKKGQNGTRTFVLYREVVLSKRLDVLMHYDGCEISDDE